MKLIAEYHIIKMNEIDIDKWNNEDENNFDE